MKATRLLLTLSALLFSVATHAEPIQWVTVGDPGNTADTDPAGYGAVATSFQIMTFEFTNAIKQPLFCKCRDDRAGHLAFMFR